MICPPESGLVWGPEQALVVDIFVMAAGHAAGLRIDAHSCSSLHAQSGIDATRRILRVLPVSVHAVGYHGGFRVTDVPGTLTRRLLEPGFTEQWARLSWIEHFPCRCIVKIQVIPNSRVEEWADALCESPFGVGSVSDHGPYLGACLHCRAHGSLGGRRTAIGKNTLPTGLATPRGRARQVRSSGAPTSRSWLRPMRGTFTSSRSLTYYPAQIAEPTAEHRKAIRGAAKVMVGAGKVMPLEFLHASGILAGARGYPRCPDAAISTAGILAEIGGGLGPPVFLAARSAAYRRITGVGSHPWGRVPGLARVGTRRPEVQGPDR